MYSEALWVEKYRPKSLGEIIDQEEIISRLKMFVKERALPHLLFAGPPGTGKTTAALALARDLYGGAWRDNVLELNASVTPDTPIMVRMLGRIRMLTFRELDKLIFAEDRESSYAVPIGLEVLSFDFTKYEVLFKPVSAIARHRVRRIVRIKHDGGELKTTPDHSVMTLNKDGRIASKRAGSLKPGDHLLSFNTVLDVMYPGYRVINPLEPPICCHSTSDTKISNTIIHVNFDQRETNASLTKDFNFPINSKEFPQLIFNLPHYERLSFLGQYIIDMPSNPSSRVCIAWLARISGIDSYLSESELNLALRSPKSGLLPAKPYLEFFKELSESLGADFKRIFNDQFPENAFSKLHLKKMFEFISPSALSTELRNRYRYLRKIIFSDIHAVQVLSVQIESYEGWVYDLGVPGSEVFWGGSIPILLHNSDERGIQTIRERVKDYARSLALGDVPFKLIILDEADNMTSDAQQALRRTMELYSRATRFCLIANYISKIIEPIQSRCAIFRFQPLPKEHVINHLIRIAEAEGVEYAREGIEAIWEICNGDMRRAINTLQAASALGKIDEHSVYRVIGRITPSEIKEMIGLALRGRFIDARNKLRDLMISYGVSGIDILKMIHREILSSRFDLNIPETSRIKLADTIGEINYRLIEGADEEIQLSTLLAKFALIGKEISYS